MDLYTVVMIFHLVLESRDSRVIVMMVTVSVTIW